ncbi:HET-domain-containing protein, partial [Byssothecium circinans]
LSHCWGNQHVLTTTSVTYEDRKERIHWTGLPKTFQDAIDCCRKLEIRYIWIDSLCILQDSHEDWDYEAGQMKHVYTNAFVTLAAAAAKNSTEGMWPHPCWQDAGALIPFDPPEAQELPLLTRAWVLQERLLSARIIYFTKNEIMWECRQLRTCECLAGDILQPSLDSGLPTLQTWQKFVDRYTSLCLTKATDRLPALSGIAEQMGQRQFGTFYAGHWELNFVNSLCWLAATPSSREPDTSVPSWSWAAAEG